MFFSDGVFAIAITLLVLEIKVPERDAVASGPALLHAIGALTPKFFAFALSFLFIGYYWYMHHTMFRYIRRSDGRLILFNLILLLCVAFLPFPVALFGSFHRYLPALVFYAASMAVTGIVQSIFWEYVSRGRRLVDATLDRYTVRLVRLRLLALPAFFAIYTPAVFFNEKYALFCAVPFIVVMRVLVGRLKRRATETQAGPRREASA